MHEHKCILLLRTDLWKVAWVWFVHFYVQVVSGLWLGAFWISDPLSVIARKHRKQQKGSEVLQTCCQNSTGLNSCKFWPWKNAASRHKQRSSVDTLLRKSSWDWTRPLQSLMLARRSLNRVLKVREGCHLHQEMLKYQPKAHSWSDSDGQPFVFNWTHRDGLQLPYQSVESESSRAERTDWSC